MPRQACQSTHWGNGTSGYAAGHQGSQLLTAGRCMHAPTQAECVWSRSTARLTEARLQLQQSTPGLQSKQTPLCNRPQPAQVSHSEGLPAAAARLSSVSQDLWVASALAAQAVRRSSRSALSSAMRPGSTTEAMMLSSAKALWGAPDALTLQVAIELVPTLVSAGRWHASALWWCSMLGAARLAA